MNTKKIYLIILLAFSEALAARARSQKPRVIEEPRNNLLFEKFEYEVLNSTWIDLKYADFRLIQRNVVRLNASLDFVKPIDRMVMRLVLYYKYKFYQKFLVDIYGEMCAFTRGEYWSPLGKLFADNLKKADVGLDMDFKLECPFPKGHFNIIHHALNISQISIPLLPAGRYRYDAFFSPIKNGPVYFKLHFYFAVSDLRVWF